MWGDLVRPKETRVCAQKYVSKIQNTSVITSVNLISTVKGNITKFTKTKLSMVTLVQMEKQQSLGSRPRNGNVQYFVGASVNFHISVQNHEVGHVYLFGHGLRKTVYTFVLWNWHVEGKRLDRLLNVKIQQDLSLYK